MAPVKPKTDVKQEDKPADPKQERNEEVSNRAESKVKVFKEKAEIKKDIAEDANTRLVNARKNANETFDDIKAENK